MSELSLIMKNTAALALARVVEKGVSVCLSFFVARHLGASALGVYSAAIVFLALITLAAEMGSASFIVREIARDRTRTAAYVVHFGGISLLVSCGLVAICFLAVPRLGYSADMTASLYAIILAAGPSVLRTIQEAVFVAHQKVEFITYSTLAASILYAGASLLLLRQGSGIVSIVIVFAGVQYLITLCYFVLLDRYIARLRWKFSWAFALRLIVQVKAFAGSSILGGLLARPEIILLSVFKNDAQIGFYSAALRIIDLWSVIPETYARNVFPILSHAHVADRDRGGIILRNSVKYLLAISLPLMSGIFVAADPIVRLLYGPGFEPSVVAVRIMAWCIPLGFLYELFWRLLAARDQQHLMLRAQMVMVLLRLIGGYLLIKSLASLGAAVGACVALLIHDVLLGYYARLDGTRLGICRAGWRFSLAALGMGAGAALLVNRSDLWVVVLVAGALYTAMVVLLKGVSQDELSVFRKMTGVWKNAG